MPNMKRTLMFTAYELIICVTPRATGSKLALSGKKQKTIQSSTPRCSGGYYSAKSNAKKLAIFFPKWAQTSMGTSARQYYSSKYSETSE